MRGLRSKFSPFAWSKRTIKVIMTAFYLIAVPAFIFIGLQPAQAVDAENLPSLEIPSISLTTPVEPSEVVNRELTVPDRIAGSYSRNSSKILLIGHSSTVFSRLKEAKIGDEVTYDNKTYQITDIVVKAKAEIKMTEILAPETEETLVLMTCFGEPLGNDDYTHRLIVTAN